MKIVVVTRGNCTAALAGLVPFAAEYTTDLDLEIVTGTPVTEGGLLTTLQHIGARVQVTMQRHPGNLSRVRKQVLEAATEPTLSIDDDVVLVGHLPTLFDLVENGGWACPVVRFQQGFDNPPTGHTEVWEPIADDDQRVLDATDARGEGWARVFDTGNLPRSTDQLPGAAFAFNDLAVTKGLLQDLDGAHISGAEDAYMGHMLGEGMVTSAVFAYHWGTWSPEKWGQDRVLQRLANSNPKLLAKLSRL